MLRIALPMDPAASDIDPLVEAALAALREAVGAAAHASIALLVDPTLSDPLSEDPEVLSALDRHMLHRVSIPAIHPDIDPDRSPYLLYAPAEPTAERAINRSIRLAIEQSTYAASPLAASRSVAAWFVGHEDAHLLATSIRLAARVRRPDGRVWPLRFWDPRVIWQLPFTLDSERWAQLRRALPGWLALDMAHRLHALAPAIALHAGEPPTPEPFRLAEWELLELVGPINMVLAMAADWGIAPVAANALRVRHLIQQCRQLGFATERDAQVFAACGLTSADDFFQHPPIAQALQLASGKGHSVSAALAHFDESVWQALRARRGASQTS